MKKISLILGSIMIAGCAASISTPQNITSNSQLDKNFVSYQHELNGPSVEVSSSFNVTNAEITKSGDLKLSGRFKIENNYYRTDSMADMTFEVNLDNLGNDEVVIKKAYLKDVDLRSVHKPVESSVFKAARMQGIEIAREIQGQIIDGQTKLQLSNKVNETFRLKN
jgi:hypothetical protein